MDKGFSMYKLLSHWILITLIISVSPAALPETPDYFQNDTPARFDNNQNPQLPPANRSEESQPFITIRSFEPIDFLDVPESDVRLSDIESVLARYLEEQNGEFTVAELDALTKELTQYYRSRGFILARVIIPEQSVVSGVVQLRLVIGRLHSVAVTGESAYGQETLKVPFRRQVGEPVQQDALERALIQLSAYPGIDLTTALAPGDEPGTTQMNLRVLEEKPLAASVVVDNQGTEDTGIYRLTMAGQYRNPTDHADMLSGSLRVSAFAANSIAGQIDYTAPLPHFTPPGPYYLWEDTDLGIGYSLTRYQVMGDFEALDLSGGSDQFYVKATRGLDYSRRHRLSADITLSKILSRTQQSNATLSDDNLTALSAGVQWENTDLVLGGGRNTLDARVTQGLGGFLGGLSGSGDAASSRDGASGEFAGGVYTVLSTRAERLQSYGDQFLSLAGTVQLSNDLLTSSEQIGFGGQNTVRGYPESSYSADSAVIVNVEYFGISGSPGAALPISNIKLAAFWDMAWGWRNDAFPSEDETPSAMSIGGYMALSVLRDYQARVDLGIPVGSSLPDDGSRFRVTFSLSRLF
ncbi:MAG: ShlB/FhaC/HecB family hemolysin secretion/activation protein [Saccharospirillum sp.]|uniref:ShlB/FhaC/HecB family hemolysin secretion/activation protein n=1 Tax=Saccharospirillum sp. TaxID=2033801 RepID=UPI003299D167